MITPSFALTATERVLPRLALDFTTASLDPRVTFTRTGGTATVVNSSGYVVGIGADLPRFDFNPVTLVCRGLLIEEARTNILSNSNDFNNTLYWSKSVGGIGVTVSSDTATGPDNTMSADKIIPSTTSNNKQLFSANFTLTNCSISYWAKESGYKKAAIRDTVSGSSAAFDLNLGTIISTTEFSGVTVSNAAISAFPNGWYRLTATFAGGASYGVGLVPLPDSYTSGGVLFAWAGDGTSGILVWGAQLEAGLFATSYIPTVASQVTRTADVANMTGTNFSDWYNASEGAFFTEATNFYPPKYQPILRVDNGAISDSIYFDIDSSAPRMVAFVSSANQCVIGTTTLTANTKFKLVGAYKLNSYAASLNAGSVGTDNLATVPTVNRLLLGNDGVNIFNGIYAKVNYYPQRLINAEVQAFSK